MSLILLLQCDALHSKCARSGSPHDVFSLSLKCEVCVCVCVCRAEKQTINEAIETAEKTEDVSDLPDIKPVSLVMECH